jgi:hypothetical protein
MRPTPTGTLDVNATESGTNGADVSASPLPSETSQKPSTKCLYFPFCLDQAPLTWLESLEKYSIDKWDQLKE